MAGPSAYERRQAIAVRCEYCCADPGVRCASYKSPREMADTRRTHMVRIRLWRRMCQIAADAAKPRAVTP